MEVNYSKVYVQENKENRIIINPEYLYLTIPAEWVCIYHKLLVYMADFGKNLIDDCTSSCKGDGKNIISCWNLFQSAIACKELGNNKQADFFINYIKSQLNIIYKGSPNNVYNGTNYYKITPDGKLEALCSCSGDNLEFTVDVETGKAYEEFLNPNKDNETFIIEDDNLIVQSENKV